MANVLVIVSHPNIDASRINKAMKESISGIDGITVHELMSAYPDFKIDVEKEHEMLLHHDVIVFQFPFYWYSSPAILKEWEDKVLGYGFATGSNGKVLSKKIFFVAISTGRPKEAYARKGYNHYSLKQSTTPYAQLANMCELIYEKPFVIYGAKKITDRELAKAVKKYRKRIMSYL